jgi:hypothetical protein
MGFRIAMFEPAISAMHGRVIFGTDRMAKRDILTTASLLRLIRQPECLQHTVITQIHSRRSTSPGFVRRYQSSIHAKALSSIPGDYNFAACSVFCDPAASGK